MCHGIKPVISGCPCGTTSNPWKVIVHMARHHIRDKWLPMCHAIKSVISNCLFVATKRFCDHLKIVITLPSKQNIFRQLFWRPFWKKTTILDFQMTNRVDLISRYLLWQIQCSYHYLHDFSVVCSANVIVLAKCLTQNPSICLLLFQYLLIWSPFTI